MKESTTSILILLVYFNRPNMVRFALDSIAAQDYDNYKLVIIDDGSDVSAWDIHKNYYRKTIPFLSVYRIRDTLEQKLAQGGSRHGEMMNVAIDNSMADVAIMLCDDDALFPGYLEGLDQYYSSNSTSYSYGHVRTFDPYVAKSYGDIVWDENSHLNRHFYPIDPFCQVDASQVSWRLDDYKKAGIKFPSPQTSALDAEVYRQMFNAFGPCEYNGLVTQYKGVFSDQMGNRADMFKPIDKESYD